jgi:hypothetical protein
VDEHGLGGDAGAEPEPKSEITERGVQVTLGEARSSSSPVSTSDNLGITNENHDLVSDDDGLGADRERSRTLAPVRLG